MARTAAVARSAVEGSAAASNLIARLHQAWPKSCPSPPGLSVFLVPEHVVSITRPREISAIPPDRTVWQRHDRRGWIELGTAWSFDSRGRTKVGWIGAVNMGSHEVRRAIEERRLSERLVFNISYIIPEIDLQKSPIRTDSPKTETY